MIHVKSWERSFGDDGRDGRYDGYAHCSLVDRSMGAVHTDLGLARLAPGARTPFHVHSFEQCAYVLEGTPVVDLEGRCYQLEAGDYALFPVGTPHAWRAPAGSAATWLELASPPVTGRAEDTVVLPHPGDRPVSRPSFGSPLLRYLGHFAGTDSQSEALALHHPARERAPAGMDTALLAYSGISVKMMVDAALGADLCTMFMVDYEPGGAAQVHDHPFEEAYVFLQGEVEGEIDGTIRTFRPGEVLFCEVGQLHGFFNTSGSHVRWVETQAPQPPRRHSYRWPAHWARLAQHSGLAGT
jgi:quercetin dioxygenase-like cupin family protein